MMKRKESVDSINSDNMNQFDEAKLDQLNQLKDIERKERKAKALNGISKLLCISEKYASLWQSKLTAMQVDANQNHIKNSKHSEVYEDALNTKEIKYFTGSLRPYQEEGLAWMKHLFLGGINGILADEMGLGKTVQIIALIGHLVEVGCIGPFLIIAPLSTIPNWRSEFHRFAPQLPVVVFHGSADERHQMMDTVRKTYKLDGRLVKASVICTYQTALTELNFLASISWNYLIIDEAQRIKNHESKLGIALRKLKCTNKLLLTGTPLQNNLTELWTLLNFIMPKLFCNMDNFASLFILEDMEEKNIREERTETETIVTVIHKVLAPFMLRRMKKDVLGDLAPKKEVLVYCPMTQLQRDLYSYVITRNVALLMGKEEQVDTVDTNAPRPKRTCTMKSKQYTRNYDIDDISDDEEFERFLADEQHLFDEENAPKINIINKKYYYSIKMQNPMMMFRRVVAHPYLISMPINNDQEIVVDENLVTSSGKMLVLDAMLTKLQAAGHKVLIFSTFVILLNLIEEYMILRQYQYRRLDGRHKMDDRQASIDDFNKKPEILAFLISTRAGGLGINLTAADTVIMFDRDWNPQVDMQAQDRCHRIGQTKPVVIYTLVTKNTIDERVLAIGKLKIRLDKIVMKDGKFVKRKGDDDTKNELLTLHKMLDESSSENIIKPNGYVFTDDELESLLDRTELIEELAKMNQNNQIK